MRAGGTAATGLDDPTMSAPELDDDALDARFAGCGGYPQPARDHLIIDLVSDRITEPNGEST